MIFYIIALIVFSIDQATKKYIVNNFELHETISVIGEFFSITSHRNKGAAFGILQEQRWFFIVTTIVIVIGLIWYIQKTSKLSNKMLPVALSLILGGAFGNFLDRLLHGEVVDFLQFRFQFAIGSLDVDYWFPIFNIADSAIVIGVILMILDMFITSNKERKSHHESNHESNEMLVKEAE